VEKTSRICTLYYLNLNLASEKTLVDSLVEKLIKPPIYHLKSNGLDLRLPYFGDSRNYLIFTGYKDVKKVEDLFKTQINFNSVDTRIRTIDLYKTSLADPQKTKNHRYVSAKVICLN